jgi:hypothetical protein
MIKLPGKPNERRPQTAMNVRDLPIHNTTDKDLFRVSNGACEQEDFLKFWLGPQLPRILLPVTASARSGTDP